MGDLAMSSGLGKAMCGAVIGAALSLAGCAGDTLLGSQTTTAALPQKPVVDPACVTLASQIEGLRKEGIGEKIEKAAAKKYKLKAADIAKVDALTKASAEFQAKCSTLVTTAQAPAATATPQPAAEPAKVAATSTGSDAAAPSQ